MTKHGLFQKWFNTRDLCVTLGQQDMNQESHLLNLPKKKGV